MKSALDRLASPLISMHGYQPKMKTITILVYYYIDTHADNLKLPEPKQQLKQQLTDKINSVSPFFSRFIYNVLRTVHYQISFQNEPHTLLRLNINYLKYIGCP